MLIPSAEPFRPSWTDCHMVISDETSLALIIRKSNHYHTQYSYQLGYMNADKFSAHVQCRVQYHNGVAELLEPDYSPLLEEAYRWIREDAQKGEDERIEARAERERKIANQGKQVTRVTGKTAREREKAKAKTA